MLVRGVRQSLFVLGGAVGLVLLIACANVANLLLVRAMAGGARLRSARRSAARGRIIRQLLTESVVLSLAGGILELIFGVVGIRALLTVNTAGLPRVGELGAAVSVDWRVMGFAFLVSLGTGVVFGLIGAPELQDRSHHFAEGEQRPLRHRLPAEQGPLDPRDHRSRARAGAADWLRAADSHGRGLAHVNPGFDASNVLTMRMSLTGPRFQDAQGVELMIRNGVEQVKSLPGVLDVGATCCVPLTGGYGLPFTIIGRPVEGRAFHGGGGWMTVSPGYSKCSRSRSSAGARSTSATMRPHRRWCSSARRWRGSGRTRIRSPTAHHRPWHHAGNSNANRTGRSSAWSAIPATGASTTSLSR